jgi:hypothetical protein
MSSKGNIVIHKMVVCAVIAAKTILNNTKLSQNE